MTKTKTKRVEAWGVVGKTGELLRVAVASHCGAIYGLKGEHLIRLTEPDPLQKHKDAVVKAAKRCRSTRIVGPKGFSGWRPGGDCWRRLWNALDAQSAAEKKAKKGTR